MVNTEPVADAKGPYSGKQSEPIVFDASDSHDFDPDDELEYIWDFGDGSTEEGVSPTHSYDKPGTYTVTLTVTDSFGDSDTFVTEAVISALDVEGDSDDDEDNTFWYVASGLSVGLLASIGALFFRRKFYV